jgi:hypothetical protein
MEETQITEKSLNPQELPPEMKSSNNKYLIFAGIFTFILILIASATGFVYLKQQKVQQDLQEKISQGEDLIVSLKEEKQLIEEDKEILVTATVELNYVVEDLRRQIHETQNPPYFTNYFPVQYRFERYQKVGQSFRVVSPQTISGIVLKASYGVGNDIYVNLYQLDEFLQVNSSSPIATGEYKATDIVKEKDFEVDFNAPVTLESGVNYGFVVETRDKMTQTAIAFAEADINETGRMYKYTRLIGGNGEILDSEHSWQPANSSDVIFRWVGTKE